VFNPTQRDYDGDGFADACDHCPSVATPANIVIVTGDVNCPNDGVIDVTDIYHLLNYLFSGGPTPCPVVQTGDVNCDGQLDVLDLVALVNYVFQGGPALCNRCALP
jgi:hypothetical protein